MQLAEMGACIPHFNLRMGYELGQDYVLMWLFTGLTRCVPDM